ncbi:MAG: hypothetical protein Q8K92_00075 [Leadbetterella sp.]|nr:hypothetical protein [Leadbetterella sp.]
MAKLINKTQEVFENMRAADKVSVMNTKKDVALIAELNKRMEVVRRDYQIKEKNSQFKASKVTLTA